MDLDKIIQRENESAEEFVKRVIEEARKNNKQYEMEFLNGKVLKTENYKFNDENFDFDLIINDYNKENELRVTEDPTNNRSVLENSQDETSEIVQYISFLETSIGQKRQEKIDNLELNLKNLGEKLEKESNRIKKLNETLVKESSRRTSMVEKLEQEKIGIVNTKIEKIEEEIKLLEEKIREKEEETNKENQTLEDYREQLNQAREAESQNLDELLTKTFNQEMVVENYQEHLDFMYEDVERLKIRLSEEKNKKVNIKKEASEKLNEIKEEVEAKIGKLEKENGYSFNIENAPTIKKIKEEMNEISQEIHVLKSTKPASFQRAKEMVNNKVSTVDLVSELSGIIKGFEDVTIDNTFGLKVSLENRQKKIEEITEKIKKTEERLNNKDNYINTDELERDQEQKERLEEENKDIQEEIENLETQLENTEFVPHLKSKLRVIQKNRDYLENMLENAIIEDEVETAENYKRRIERLNNKEIEITDQIEELKGTLSLKNILTKPLLENKIKKLKSKKKKNRLEIKKINGKSKEDYSNYEAIVNDEIELRNLKDELEELNKTKEELKTITTVEMVCEISEKYQNLNKSQNTELDIDEPIESYEEAPKSLIDRIKSKEFRKKAIKALSGIVAGIIIISGISKITNDTKDNGEVVAEETEEKQIDDIIIEDAKKKEPTVTTNEEVKSKIEQMQDDALEEIINAGASADVYDNIYDAADRSNAMNVGNNNETYYENAAPGALYAIKDGERVKVDIQDAVKYMEDGYEVVMAIENENQTIGYTPLTLTSGLQENSTEKTM